MVNELKAINIIRKISKTKYQIKDLNELITL